MTSTNPTNLMSQVAALETLSNSATRTIRLDENTDLYIVVDKTTGREIGRFETYHEAKQAR